MENTRLFKTLRPMDAKTVARDGYRGLMAGKTLVISGFRNWLVAESVRFSPRKMVTAVSRKLLDKAEWGHHQTEQSPSVTNPLLHTHKCGIYTHREIAGHADQD